MKLFGVPMLMYHWVNPDLGDRLRLYGVTPYDFARQMDLLEVLGWRAAPLGALLDHVAGVTPLPSRSVILTFDDGYRDNVEYAGPVLEARGWRATIFHAVGRAGDVNTWDLAHGDPPRPLLSWDEMRALDGGVFSFESHSLTHPDLTAVDPARARAEIADSKKLLEDRLGRTMTVFSYPHGAFNLALEAEVRAAGYRAAVTDLQGLNRAGTDPLRLRRTMITSRDVLPTCLFKILTGYGAYGLVEEVQRRLAGRPPRFLEAHAG